MKNIISIQRLSTPTTTTTRNGNGIFCSNFNGRFSIEDKGSGLKDIVEW